MPPESFLHERGDFKALVETVADSEKINDPALVEKDYWIMHAVFGLKQGGLTFELKGGTSLFKGFGVIHRFSEDIDIRIEPFDGVQVDTNPNHENPRTLNRGDSFLTSCAIRSRSRESPRSRGTQRMTTRR
ncbi:MAG TPA: nucleotidyl transferase AbiEii/AbiGii toxin family protein [Terriglobales bacterium]|nr:nucleotidyl transferase AbiEii/AbiGii toxin family protein [Terriglobales bacterium]